jgi:hypothetical protein
VRVLFGLVMMRLSHAGDSAVESMLVIDHLGAAADRQGAAIECPGATSDRQGAFTGCRVSLLAAKVPLPTARVPPPMRCVDRGCHRSRQMDLHACPTVCANCHGL